MFSVYHLGAGQTAHRCRTVIMFYRRHGSSIVIRCIHTRLGGILPSPLFCLYLVLRSGTSCFGPTYSNAEFHWFGSSNHIGRQVSRLYSLSRSPHLKGSITRLTLEYPSTAPPSYIYSIHDAAGFTDKRCLSPETLVYPVRSDMPFHVC